MPIQFIKDTKNPQEKTKTVQVHTKLIYSIGTHHNPANFTTIGYCTEHPKEVLKYALNQGFRIGGYRQAGMTRCWGEGLVIRGTDMEPVDFGLSITGRLEKIPFSRYPLGQDLVTEEDLQWMFGHRGGEISFYHLGLGLWTQNIFGVPEKYLNEKHKIIMSTAREFVEVVKGRPVTLDYLKSLGCFK